MSRSGKATDRLVKLSIIADYMKARTVKKILRPPRRLRMGDHQPCFTALLLLCTLFSLLPLTADDYLECTDLTPDEFLDIPALIQRPAENLVILFLYVSCMLPLSGVDLSHPNPMNLIPGLPITSKIISSTVIRI